MQTLVHLIFDFENKQNRMIESIFTLVRNFQKRFFLCIMLDILEVKKNSSGKIEHNKASSPSGMAMQKAVREEEREGGEIGTLDIEENSIELYASNANGEVGDIITSYADFYTRVCFVCAIDAFANISDTSSFLDFVRLYHA